MMVTVRGVLAGIAAAALIGGAAGCGTSSVVRQTTTTTTSVALQGRSACTDLDGTVGPDGICHVRSATPTYTIEMSFPIDYPEIDSVAAFLKRNRDDFIDWVTQVGPGQKRGRPYLYAVTAKTFRSGAPGSGTQSLVLTIDNDTGLAHEGHPNTTFRAFNFDLAKRVPITFDTLFKPGTRPLEVLDPIVRRKLDAPDAELDEETYQNFAITNDAVIFFFGQDQVVHDNAGPHQVAVPRSELAPLLA
ncbi:MULTISPECIES: esterase [unclassified Mycobacterium]|uniref:esterase n=1 Tax=unclassified Mycobacterium TaxID=2642494 RepID=UPI0006DD2633|nr:MULTISPECIES: esterase [unclassified Mycobacterium]